MKIIEQSNLTVVGVDDSGVEYVAIPIFEHGVKDTSIWFNDEPHIEIYKLSDGGALHVEGILTLPENAEPIAAYAFDDCDDSDAGVDEVYRKCERMLLALK